MNTPILLAAAGGLSINLLNLLEYSNVLKPERPDFRDWLFWLPWFAWPFFGALLAFAYVESGVKLSPILALNIGLSAPLILRAMIQSNPMKQKTIDPGTGA